VLGLDLLPAEARAIRLLTRLSTLAYADYIEGIGCITDGYPDARRVACEVKLADLRDHLGRIPERVDWQTDAWERTWGAGDLFAVARVLTVVQRDPTRRRLRLAGRIALRPLEVGRLLAPQRLESVQHAPVWARE
jgi:hypothetical protein